MTGEPRGSAQNNVVLEFLGDYVYADAMNDFGVAVWNDTRQAAACTAVNEWREDVQAAGELTEELLAARPAIEQVCPTVTTEAGLTAWFGNSDIWAWSGADPTT